MAETVNGVSVTEFQVTGLATEKARLPNVDLF